MTFIFYFYLNVLKLSCCFSFLESLLVGKITSVLVCFFIFEIFPIKHGCHTLREIRELKDTQGSFKIHNILGKLFLVLDSIDLIDLVSIFVQKDLFYLFLTDYLEFFLALRLILKLFKGLKKLKETQGSLKLHREAFGYSGKVF